MTVLVISPDEDAARSLCSALGRSGQIAIWEQALDGAERVLAERTPLVVVADTCVDGHEELLAGVRCATPWARVYLMVDPSRAAPRTSAAVVPKPFDAAQLADVLTREIELAQLERGRRSLQAHAEELGLLVEASFEAIIGLAADGTILSWNRGAHSMYGYGAGEIVGRNINLLDPTHGELRADGGVQRLVEERVRHHKDGREILVLMSLSQVQFGSPTSLAFAEVTLDMTARRKLERELEHAERLAAIGRLAASMAHEINNPLAVIRASNAYVHEVAEATGDPELAASVEDMELAVERISSFVQHVCGFARRERPQLEDAPLDRTVALALRMVRPRAIERGVALAVESSGATERVPHDPPRLAQAIVNVVANAVDAAAEGGKHVCLRVLRREGRVSVEVDDDGPGVDETIRGQVFEPFATTKPHGQGTGLGLAITRQILQDHGGSVELTPLETGGTRARLELPTLDVSSFRVVVLDPDPALRRVLSADLRRSSFDVSTFDSLAAAAETLRRGDVHVVVTDARLPDAAGEQLIERIRDLAPNARCLALSAEGLVHELRHADDVLGKPWDRDLLAGTVRQLCLDGDAPASRRQAPPERLL